MIRVLLIAYVLMLLGAVRALASDSTTTCRVDGGGHRICVERQREAPHRRCTTTCRTDSGGHQVCRTRCR